MSRYSIAKSAVALLLLAVPLAMPFQAATRNFEATVTRTLTTGDNRFGGCMASLNVSPSASGLNCPASKWVTFSCTGEHTTKVGAQRMFDAAQMAFVTGRKVRLWVTDEKKHNGHCFVSRIDVLAASAASNG